MEYSANVPENTNGQESSREMDEDKLVKDLSGMLECMTPPLSPLCCIYKVPHRLRDVNEADYTPQMVSIGPLHHGAGRLQLVEQHKCRYLAKFLARSRTTLKAAVLAIKEREDYIRSCYGQGITLNSTEFVRMVLLDTSFIIELFLRTYYPNLQDEHDKILFTPWVLADIEHDLILLENQLPFFIIKSLYDLAFANSFPDNIYPSFLELAFNYFKTYNQEGKTPQVEAKHFTDMLRTFMLPWALDSQPKQEDNIVYIRSATDLERAGVIFKASSSKSVLDIQFTDGVLELPLFYVTDRSESFIRNIMALEQTYYPYSSHICHLILLMDCLINTERDVDLLVAKKILVNGLGDSTAVSTMINNLCKHVTITDSYFLYTRTCKDLNAYYDVLWHSWNATFMRDYFGNPWLTVSTIAAFLLLALTFIQAICAILTLQK